ncbi:unnamed protein product [Amaranthus hypochondriacus]
MSTPFLILFICLNLSNLFLTSLSSPYNKSSILSSCHKDDHNALIKLKESFSFLQSDQFNTYGNATNSWKNDTDCCQWEGIRCHPDSHRVIVLNLFNNGIKGIISSNSTLFQLYYLQSLNLSSNDFSESTISPKFGKFRFLKHLHLSNSYFSGRVPLELAQLSKLTSLDLSFNIVQIQNSNTIFHNLTSLRFLNLDQTHLDSQFFQSITNLSLLTELHLMGCNLQGELPHFIFNLPHLKILDLKWNEVIKFPSSTNNCSSPLEILYLSFNNISSNFPPFIGQSKHLRSLDVSYCSLSGTIPMWVWNISESIVLGDNELIGGIPSSMNTTKLSSLTHLDLANNHFVGEIPNWLFNLKLLEHIDLSSNNFSGGISLHTIFSSLPNLVDINLSSSGLSVTIIDSPTTMPNQLERLQLSNTIIEGEFPMWLQKLVRDFSIDLDLSYNSLSGVLERLPWGDSFYIDISNNMLTGNLPIVSSPYTVIFDASNNKFIGPIHSSICNLTSLGVLDLSNNSLSGSFPNCLGSFNDKFFMLNLGLNNISGTLPKKFSKCGTLEYLDLESNQLHGQLPRSLAQCTWLNAINLKNNNFTDEFPSWLHTLSNIQILDISSNNFYGRITNISDKHPFSQLQIVDLSNNHISGVIPITYIKNFRAMMQVNKLVDSPEYRKLFVNEDYYYKIVLAFKAHETVFEKIITTFSYLDLSNNEFEGEIPECIGELISINGLNLSHNRLTGRIPESISMLSHLESLDISSNLLSGHIPQELVALTFLEFFNVSDNKLEGLIPEGNNFNTYLADSYQGNLGLCGTPLPECGGSHEPSTNNTESNEDGESVLSMWKIIVMGFTSGVVVGFAWGYYMLSVGKPFWFIKLANTIECALIDFREEHFGRRRRKQRIARE